MAEDYFNDAADSSAPEEPRIEGEEETEGTEATALLPKDFFHGKPLEPGVRCEIEIVKDMDDEVQVKYVPHKDKETSEETEETKPQNAMTAMLED